VTWIIEDALAYSEYPYTEELDILYEEGVRAIVSLERRYDKAIIKEKGFEYLEVYVKDYTAPTIDQLTRINRFVDSMIDKKKPVLVHCIAGGRSGTVLTSYLISRGRSFNNALKEVRTKVPFAVDDFTQEEVLQLFEMKARAIDTRDIDIAGNELEKAEFTYHYILSYLESLNGPTTESKIAAVYFQLGMIAQERQQFDEAEERYTKALEIRERQGLEQYVAAVYFQLGMIAQERQQFDEAEEWYAKALEIRGKLELD
jgi:tetratricopeptide (TPR) repeat protein